MTQIFRSKMVGVKQCFKCGGVYDLTAFYKHKQMADGHLNKCKDCTKKDTAARLEEKLKDPEFHENEKARHREKYYRLEYKEKHKPTPEKRKESIDKHKKKYPEKYKAKNATQRMTRTDGNHLHHWSYNEEHWKDVLELEPKFHARIHRDMEYCEETHYYKTLDGVLLDTREKHESYIFSLEVERYS